MKKKLAAFGLALLAMAALVGCGDEKSVVTDVEDTEENQASGSANLSFDKDGYAEVAKNSAYTLSINENASSIRVKDEESGAVWDSAANSPDFDKSTVNDKWQKKMESPFELFYTDLENGYGAVINLTLLEMEYSVSFENIENGVRVLYNMSNPNVEMAIDYSIDDNGLVVEIPTSQIKENGKFSVTSIKMMPYLADAADSAEGYYFYPDGSGAIMEFKDSSHFRESELALPMYGDLRNYKNMKGVLDEAESEVLLPVFGASLEDRGFVAIIENGAETATVKILPTNEVIGINSISCEFAFRRSFSDARAADNLTFDKDIIGGTRKISYRMFHDGETTYSDMAKVYRDYLVDECGVTSRVKEGDYPLSLDLFMGIKEEGLLFDEFKSVTSFKQAEDILGELEEAGVSTIDLQLKGWTKDGYYTAPKQFPVNSKAGGGSGLKDLISYASDKDIDVVLEADFLEALTEQGGFNERNDVIYLGNKTIFSDYSDSMFLLTPTAAKSNLDKFIKDAKKYDIDGISFYSLGQYLLYNYNSSYFTTQAGCAQIWKDMFNASTDNYGKAIVQGGNSYVIGSVDKITDLPSEDSGYQMTTKSVPFYQIAVHGLVEYTGKAGNLSSDIADEKLEWIECGYTPYFEWTHEGSEDLMYTAYSTLFSSTYTDWLDDAVAIYEDFNADLKDLQTVFIDQHEQVEEEVYKTTYENGTAVYVNYSDKAVTVDGVKIDAQDYAVKKG